MNTETESERLDQHYKSYRRDSVQDDLMRSKTVETFRPYLNSQGSGLELGCSDGYMTELLAQSLKKLTVVEGSASFISEAKSRRLDNVNFHQSLFEDYAPTEEFDYVFATFVLTHVEDLSGFMKMVHDALNGKGYFFVVVPNARSLSRQLARHMGFIESLTSLSENDRNHGHRHSYERVSLSRVLTKFGFKEVASGGLMLKQLADFQMDELFARGILDETHIEGLHRLGMEYPDLCSAVYSICQPA